MTPRIRAESFHSTYGNYDSDDKWLNVSSRTHGFGDASAWMYSDIPSCPLSTSLSRTSSASGDVDPQPRRQRPSEKRRRPTWRCWPSGWTGRSRRLAGRRGTFAHTVGLDYACPALQPLTSRTRDALKQATRTCLWVRPAVYDAERDDGQERHRSTRGGERWARLAIRHVERRLDVELSTPWQ